MILLATTTVTVERPTANADAFEAATFSTTQTGIPGHISGASGSESQGNGSQEAVNATLAVNKDVDIQRQDRITDELTGDVWYVAWTRTRQGLGLDRRMVGLKFATGTA